MKKRLFGRLGVVALALTLVSMTLMGGTLAKYTADVSGSATATVAKFAFDLNGATQKSSAATIGLADLFKDSYNSGDVKAASSGSLVVAPDTSGKVAITLKNDGEVAIKPTFTITEKNNNADTINIPLQYAITTADTTPGTNDWKDAKDLKPTDTKVAVGAEAQAFYLHWRWNPTSTDAADTALGIKDTLDTVKLEIKCTVEQVVTTPAS